MCGATTISFMAEREIGFWLAMQSRLTTACSGGREQRLECLPVPCAAPLMLGVRRPDTCRRIGAGTKYHKESLISMMCASLKVE